MAQQGAVQVTADLLRYLVQIGWFTVFAGIDGIEIVPIGLTQDVIMQGGTLLDDGGSIVGHSNCQTAVGWRLEANGHLLATTIDVPIGLERGVNHQDRLVGTLQGGTIHAVVGIAASGCHQGLGDNRLGEVVGIDYLEVTFEEERLFAIEHPLGIGHQGIDAGGQIDVGRDITTHDGVGLFGTLVQLGAEGEFICLVAQLDIEETTIVHRFLGQTIHQESTHPDGVARQVMATVGHDMDSLLRHQRILIQETL